MSFTTTSTGNAPNLSSLPSDSASSLRKAGLQDVALLGACFHHLLNLHPLLRPADCNDHIARLVRV